MNEQLNYAIMIFFVRAMVIICLGQLLALLIHCNFVLRREMIGKNVQSS
jgi:hypothetical protein